MTNTYALSLLASNASLPRYLAEINKFPMLDADKEYMLAKRYQETGDIYLVADVLGHADVNTTRKHYAAMSDANKRKAARAVPLPRTDQSEDSDKK